MLEKHTKLFCFVIVLLGANHVIGFHVTKRSHFGDDVFDCIDSVKYKTHESTGILSTTTLVCLARKPLMFVSSGTPLLSANECWELNEYCSSLHRNGATNKNCLLVKLQNTLDDLILRRNSTSVEPRFLSYDPTDTADKLPDGLHVDTNNGKFFRYLTVLVYLTSSNAATTFPLANLDEMNPAVKAAHELIAADIHHTRQSTPCENHTVRQRLIESTKGFRVVPRQGHIVAFVGIDRNSGKADAYSFHGSEASSDHKQVLSFFYEIPVNSFTSQTEFGHQVGIQVDALKQKYCSIS